LLRLVKGTAKAVNLPEKSAINMIWLPAPYFWLANHKDWSRWFASNSSHKYNNATSFSFMGGVAKK
jgi:hypothetical protein